MTVTMAGVTTTRVAIIVPALRWDVARAYARDCAVRITKIHRPNGTVVTRRVRNCDRYAGRMRDARGPPAGGLSSCVNKP